MTPEEKSVLLRTHELAEENNKILRKMRRASRLGMLMHALYWVLIIVVGFGAFYFVQPFVESLLGAFDAVGGLPGLKSGVTQFQDAARTFDNIVK